VGDKETRRRYKLSCFGLGFILSSLTKLHVKNNFEMNSKLPSWDKVGLNNQD